MNAFCFKCFSRLNTFPSRCNFNQNSILKFKVFRLTHKNGIEVTFTSILMSVFGFKEPSSKELGCSCGDSPVAAAGRTGGAANGSQSVRTLLSATSGQSPHASKKTSCLGAVAQP
jgi:hypothetical protein